MEGRMKKFRPQVSPERAKVWTEKSPKYQQKIKKIPVVYYLCRNRQLEHPHFMEITLSSPDGLYLRDVIERLNALRGRGMASMYSWSSKRSYRNGFVWHDLSEDDLILPAHGNEYVLKGSELFDESNSDHSSPIGSTRTQNLKQLPEPPSSRSLDDSSSSSSMNGKGTKHSQEDELSPPALPSGSSAVSPDSGNGKASSWRDSLCLTEYKVYKNECLADASTQTDENVIKATETCSRGVSTDEESLESEISEEVQNSSPCINENGDIHRNSVSPPSSINASSLSGKTETLEALIRADASKMSSFRVLDQDDIRMPANSRIRATDMLMQLISCGSISVKDNSFGIVPTYKPKSGQSKFPSSFFSSSFMLGEFDRLSENPRLMGLRLEDKEYFSGSLIETKKMIKDTAADGNISLKRSSSCNAHRTNYQPDSSESKDESNQGGAKCIMRSIKASITKQPRSESMRSPVSDRSRDSSESSKKPDSFNVVRIEERLASGARIVIQSKATSDSTVLEDPSRY